MSDTALRDATDVLERLSADPAAQMLARQRELAMVTYTIEMTAARREGREEGREETLRVAIADLCEAYGVALDDRRRKVIADADLATLDALRVALKRGRAWPDEG